MAVVVFVSKSYDIIARCIVMHTLLVGNLEAPLVQGGLRAKTVALTVARKESSTQPELVAPVESKSPSLREQSYCRSWLQRHGQHSDNEFIQLCLVLSLEVASKTLVNLASLI